MGRGRAGGLPLVPAIETARGVLAAQEIACVPGVAHMSIGGLDLLRDLYAGDGGLPMLYVRSHLVVVSRAAGLPPPVDSVYPLIDDDAGLRAEAEFVRSLGFGAKSAIHPRQIPILHEVFAPSPATWSGPAQVLAAFEAAGRGATRLPDGSSSTCRWRSARSGWRSPATSGGKTPSAPDPTAAPDRAAPGRPVGARPAGASSARVGTNRRASRYKLARECDAGTAERAASSVTFAGRLPTRAGWRRWCGRTAAGAAASVDHVRIPVRSGVVGPAAVAVLALAACGGAPAPQPGAAPQRSPPRRPCRRRRCPRHRAPS